MSTADQICVAELTGAARRHARWRELAAGRTDLLAQVAGLLEGTSEGQPDEPLMRQATELCRQAVAHPELIPGWIDEPPTRPMKQTDSQIAKFHRKSVEIDVVPGADPAPARQVRHYPVHRSGRIAADQVSSSSPSGTC